MARQLFEHPRTDKLFWVPVVSWGLILLLVAAVLVRMQSVFDAVIVVLLGSAALAILVYPVLATAERVSISGSGLSVHTYANRDIYVPWQEIGVIQRFHRLTLAGPAEVVRLVSRDGRTQVILTSRMRDFTDLLRQIQTKCPQAQEVEPRSWQRLRWWT